MHAIRTKQNVGSVLPPDDMTKHLLREEGRYWGMTSRRADAKECEVGSLGAVDMLWHGLTEAPSLFSRKQGIP